MEINKNDIVDLEIESISSEGHGVGRHEGITVFVPMTAVGDIVSVKIVKVKTNVCYGIINKIKRESSHRIPVDCVAFSQCGGCAYRHMTYEAELEAKYDRVASAITRIAKLDLKPNEIIGMESIDRYRNKAQIPLAAEAGALKIGFYAARSHRVINCRDCLLQPAVFKDIIQLISDWILDNNIDIYDEAKHSGLLRNIYIRNSIKTNQIMVCLVANGDVIPHIDKLISNIKNIKNLKCVALNINKKNTNVILGEKTLVLWGEDHIEDIINGIKLRISPKSFHQVNTAGAETLYSIVKDYCELDGSETILDLYCGAGAIGLTLAEKSKLIVGVEIVSDAIRDARINAKINGIENAKFICADSKQALYELEKMQISPDIVILDPPRKGCSKEVIEDVASILPEKIIYVSCEPSTLARDLALLSSKGYALKQITPVDMFPRTKHVETVCLLSKLHADQHIEVELKMDEMDLTAAESKATYEEIKAYVKEQAGLQVSNLYIAQVKQKCDIIERVNYNLPKSENSRQPKCPPEKEAAIREALEHFHMI